MEYPESDPITEELAEDLIPPEQSETDEDDVEVPQEVEDWKTETKGIERIISVGITLHEPKTAEWIASEALVSEQTAREHLETFADLGVIAATTARGVTRYQVDEAFLHYREVSRVVEQHSKDSLLEEVEELKDRIETVKSKYEVERPDELRSRVAEEGTDIEKIRTYKKIASEWETLQDRLAVYKDAIDRFEKFDRTISASV